MAAIQVPQVKSKTVTLPIDSIEVEHSLQCRVAIAKETIEEYRDLIAAGVKFPPVVVVRYPDDRLILVDGFTRRQAYILASKAKIPAKVVDGDRKLAVQLACGANSDHGVRRSQDDKRKAVRLAIAEFSELSSRAIGEVCGCSHTFVDKIRKQIEEATKPQPAEGELHWEDVPESGNVATPEPAKPAKVKVEANKAPKGGEVPAKANPEFRDLSPGCKACGNAKHLFSDASWVCSDCGEVWESEPAKLSWSVQPPELKKVEVILGQLVRELDRVGKYEQCKGHLSAIQSILNGG